MHIEEPLPIRLRATLVLSYTGTILIFVIIVVFLILLLCILLDNHISNISGVLR